MLPFHCLGAAADVSESEDNTLTSKTDLSMLSDEGLELSQRQTDTIFQGPSLDEQAEELVIGTVLNLHVMGCYYFIITVTFFFTFCKEN